LNFAYAENLEVKKDYPAVHSVFEKLLEVLRKDLTALDLELGPPAEHSGPSSQESTITQPVEPNGNAKANPRSQEFAEKKTEYGLAWIMYMRFARRAENVMASRAVFGKARRDKFVTWEVYEAAGKNIVPRAKLKLTMSQH
jgi:cleavage stimulation factor subunit 3